MKHILKIFMVIMTSVAFLSCEKKLTDLQPIDQIPGEKAILTMNDLTSAVNGVYATWSARRSVHISTLISDEARLGVGSEYRNVGNILFNWQFVSDSQDWRDGETGGVWTNLYAVVDRANRVLELMEPVPTTSAAELALKNQFRGEMFAARAMANLELLRCYSQTAEYNPTALGVVLQTSYSKNVATYRPTRNTQGEVMASINADLIAARAAIPSSFSDIGRITQNAVIGAQARAALHTKNWQAVIDRSTEVISLQPITNPANYPFIWTTRTLASNQSTEVIWKLNVSAANLGSAIGSLWQDANTAVQASPAAKLLNTYNATTDIRFSTFFRTTPRNLIAKYGVSLSNGSENFQFDIKMMRTSELLLARAEAYAALNQIAPANTDLSNLRTNRITGYTHTNIPLQADLITEIYLERYKELCYEGQRYFDLRRRSLPINRDLSDIGGILTSQNLTPTEFRYILPIPIQELQANPSIVQNAGY
jgi:starch-binding outer membrane protein, SusD/RagB family